MNIIFAIAMGGAFIAGGALTALYFWFDQNEKRIASLEAQLAKKEHTVSTSAGVMDSISCLLNAKSEAEVMNLWIDKASRILGVVNSGPRAYDPETPAGMRPKGKGK
jgi:hypothetical protein